MRNRTFTVETEVDISIYDIVKWIYDNNIGIDELFNDDVIREYFTDNYENEFREKNFKSILSLIPNLTLDEMEKIRDEADYFLKHYESIKPK